MHASDFLETTLLGSFDQSVMHSMKARLKSNNISVLHLAILAYLLGELSKTF